MAEMVLVYVSMTGNTEAMANAIAEGIRGQGKELDVMDIMECSSASVLEQYEGIILGAYTWDDGALPDEFKDLYDEMDEIDLTGKKAAAFGSGDSGYDHFCGAVDLLIEKLQERGAEVVMEGLKVEMSPSDEDIEKCKEFGRKFVHQLENPGVI